MKKIYLALIVAIIITWLVAYLKPGMHKAVRLENPDFKIEETVV